MYYFGVGLRDGLGVEGCGSQQHLICADAQSPPITLRAVASAALHRPQDLWRQIVWSPDGQRRVDLRIYSHMSTAGQSHMTECRLTSDKHHQSVILQTQTGAKITQSRVTLRRQENVIRLNVSTGREQTSNRTSG